MGDSTHAGPGRDSRCLGSFADQWNHGGAKVRTLRWEAVAHGLSRERCRHFALEILGDGACLAITLVASRCWSNIGGFAVADPGKLADLVEGTPTFRWCPLNFGLLDAGVRPWQLRAFGGSIPPTSMDSTSLDLKALVRHMGCH